MLEDTKEDLCSTFPAGATACVSTSRGRNCQIINLLMSLYGIISGGTIPCPSITP
jgi:hypothetical protein